MREQAAAGDLRREGCVQRERKPVSEDGAVAAAIPSVRVTDGMSSKTSPGWSWS